MHIGMRTGQRIKELGDGFTMEQEASRHVARQHSPSASLGGSNLQQIMVSRCVLFARPNQLDRLMDAHGDGDRLPDLVIRAAATKAADNELAIRMYVTRLPTLTSRGARLT
jgi:hypothetical protein